ncbi:MAG: DUF2497 domain-containing protein [Alphaproteobacteria bacterium]|nr:DUF2497 domain-containing protein [Alphaproteobacteria bacterium]
MAEDNQENEMEDILSSIKNILEEDEQKQNIAASESKSESEDVLSDVLDTSSDIDDVLELSSDMRVDDVLELSPDMRVDDKNTIDNLLSENTTAEQVSLSQNDTNADPLVEIENINIGIADEDSDPLFAIDNDKEASGPLSIVDEVLAQETSEEPAEEHVADTPIIENITVEDNSASDVEGFEKIVEEIADVDTSLIDSVSLETQEITDENPQLDNASTDTPVVENETYPIQETSPVSDDVTDVSANIISNFAKMFSREEKEEIQVEKTAPVEAITTTGDTNKTLEQFVLDSIVKVIGNEISNKWENGADFRSFAEAEITRQTTAWINDNLPTLVEKIVKQEIERVIAKVGS